MIFFYHKEKHLQPFLLCAYLLIAWNFNKNYYNRCEFPYYEKKEKNALRPLLVCAYLFS